MSSKLVTWIDETVELFGQPVPLKLKLPPHGASREFMKRMREIRAPEMTIDSLFDGYGEWIDQVFSKWVRLPEPLEIDGERIENGQQLPAAVNTGLVLTILGRLEKLVWLTEREGKASGSPSTPSVAAASETAGSSSPAPFIGPEDGPTP